MPPGFALAAGVLAASAYGSTTIAALSAVVVAASFIIEKAIDRYAARKR